MSALDAESALREQAKGVLVFRYAVHPTSAGRLLDIWASAAGVTSHAIAHALIHHICLDDGCTAPSCRDMSWLLRWLEGRLRHHPTEDLDAPELIEPGLGS